MPSQSKQLDRGAGRDRRRDPVGPDPGQEYRPGRDLAQRPGHPPGRGAGGARRSASGSPTTVNALRAAHDYLFTTGGIGPTHDDITVDLIAAAFGVPVVVHPEARRSSRIITRLAGIELTELRLRMARVPEGAELIANPSSGAPGVKISNVYILAGVPQIAASMLEALSGTLEGGRPMVSVTVGAFRPRAKSPTCCARPRPSTRAWRSAAIRSSRTAATAPTSSCDRKTATRRGAAARTSCASFPLPASR